MTRDETFYRKEISPGGRAKYVPVLYWDAKLQESKPEGSYLVTVAPGLTSTVTIDPELAPFAALPYSVRNEIAELIEEALELQKEKRFLEFTQEQETAWQALYNAFDGSFWISRPGTAEVSRQIVELLAMKAKELKETGVV